MQRHTADGGRINPPNAFVDMRCNIDWIADNAE
jgi:hypothetical protein